MPDSPYIKEGDPTRPVYEHKMAEGKYFVWNWDRARWDTFPRPNDYRSVTEAKENAVNKG